MIQRRIPRPIGTTEIGYHHYKDPSTQNKDKLLNHIITHYNTNNFSYCNRHYNIEQLSILLNIQSNTILQGTIQYGHTLQANMDTLTSGEALRALYSICIQGSLEDRSRALEQLSILRASQGDSYKPFVSGEVNKSLKLVMESNSSMASVLQGLFKGSGGTNIFLPGAAGGTEGDRVPSDALTTDEAIMQLKALGVPTLADDKLAQEHIYGLHNIEGMPEVGARLQTNVDTSKEALNLGNVEDLQHIDRRANELNIDLNDDEI